MSLPVILRPEAEVDIQAARDQLAAVRVGLGNQVLARVREVLARIEKMPELHGNVWEDVRAARLKQFRQMVMGGLGGSHTHRPRARARGFYGHRADWRMWTRCGADSDCRNEGALDPDGRRPSGSDS